MSTYNIKDWKKLFDQIYTGKAVDGKIVATKMLGDMAINNEGVIDKTILDQITAEYQTYKDVITTGKKTDAQIEEDIVKNPKLKKFEDLRQLELNLSKAGSVGDIHKQVQVFIRDRWDGNLKNVAINPQKVIDVIKEEKQLSGIGDVDHLLKNGIWLNGKMLNLNPLLEKVLISPGDNSDISTQK